MRFPFLFSFPFSFALCFRFFFLLFSFLFLFFGLSFAKHLALNESFITLQKALDPKLQEIVKNGVMHNYYKKQSNLKALKKKLALNKGLKIMILGDSHVAGDVFSRRLREILGANSAGFIYPAFPKYHYSHFLDIKSSNFEIINSIKSQDENFPFGGVIARAKNSNAIITIAQNAATNEIQNVQFVFYAPNLLAAFSITDSNGRKIYLSSKNPKKWDISKSYELKLPLQINALIRDVKLGGYFMQSNSPSYIYHAGINGAKSSLYQKWDKAFVQDELKILNHDLVILSYGTNDILASPDRNEFKKTYKALIRMLRSANPKAVFVLISPPPVYQEGKNKMVSNYKSIKDAIKEIASDLEISLFDINELVKKTGSKQRWISLKISQKDVHLTPLGYRIIADSLYYSLIKMLNL